MDWQIKQKTKNISSCLSENESLYFFHYIYFAVCLIGEAIQKARMPCEVCPRCNGFLAHMRPGKKGRQKKCGRCPSPLRLRFDTAVLLCKSLSLHVVLVLTQSYALVVIGLAAWRCCWWMSLSRLRTDQSGWRAKWILFQVAFHTAPTCKKHSWANPICHLGSRWSKKIEHEEDPSLCTY